MTTDPVPPQAERDALREAIPELMRGEVKFYGTQEVAEGFLFCARVAHRLARPQ